MKQRVWRLGTLRCVPTLTIKWNEEHQRAEITVWASFPNAGVDRPQTSGWCTFDASIASRMYRAIEAGVVVKRPQIKTDVNGKTYVAYRSDLYWKHANAELRRLGF